MKYSMQGVEQGLNLLRQVLQKAGVMFVSKNRADYWATKGFDGISEMMLERSAQETPITQDQINILDKCITLLEASLSSNQTPYTDNVDEFIFQGLKFITDFLRRRTHELGLGPLDADAKVRVTATIEKLKIAKARFNATTKT